MVIILQLAKVMGVLVRGVKSRTTKDQWMGNIIFLVMACAVGTLLVVYGGMEEDAVLGGIVAAQTLVGPYFSRGMSWIHSRIQGKVKVDPALQVVWARYNQGAWKTFSGSLLDAREEGFDFAVIKETGKEVRLKFMELTGLRVFEAHKRESQ